MDVAPMSQTGFQIPAGRAAPAEGLYDPQFEHDACGVGLIARVDGRADHHIVQDALTILNRLNHRGACGCDPQTGDGAGIIVQMPDGLYRPVLARQGVELPARGQYGVGMFFLPTEADQRVAVKATIDAIVRREGQVPLAWREVPVCSDVLGWVARSQEPAMGQLFIGAGRGLADAMAFERRLYVIRRQVEKAIWDEGSLPQKRMFYCSSCSSRTVVYKGMLRGDQLLPYYPDLSDERLSSSLAIVHSRYSTNTMPDWGMAQPFRFIAHNGEINTVRGNRAWMATREGVLSCKAIDENLKKVFPICIPGISDSASFDRALELLHMAGRSLPHALMMMVPQAWESDTTISEATRAFYRFHANLIEPWDGPASLAFTDGTLVGATLDRNGLRPSRYSLTHDGLLVLASETGVLAIDDARVRERGRLQPGRMLLVDTARGEVIGDARIKEEISARQPWGRWLDEHAIHISSLTVGSGAGSKPPEASAGAASDVSLLSCQQAFGYTQEDLWRIIVPMAQDAQEPVGSMGTDTPLAVLSERSQLLFNYFKQQFAQVTNPPIDPIREAVVMSTRMLLGSEGNLLDETAMQARSIELDSPLLSDAQLAGLRSRVPSGFRIAELSLRMPIGPEGVLHGAVEQLMREAADAVRGGANLLILSDVGIDAGHAAIPSLLATSAIHHHLVRNGLRSRCSLIVQTGEAREVMHFALLIGYGASAVNPWMIYRTLEQLSEQGALVSKDGAALSIEKAVANFHKAIDKGLLKVLSKMGISTLMSYHGAQIFEAIGLSAELVSRYFCGTASRLSGIGLDVIELETLKRHEVGFPRVASQETPELELGGDYMWRRRGEYHQWNPETIQKLQHAVSGADERRRFESYRQFSASAYDNSRALCTLRGLFEIQTARQRLPLELVEPAKEIVKRFCTGAMSFGSISAEVHETLAIAMNRLGGRSNTGEGGEDPVRFQRLPNGDSKNSAIKQVASGRFGVTANYLANAIELQIKMAQGAKPGEGGQLPGHKVDDYIARTRYSTPGVGLISPPPHHDIYSIEDLAQLIFDLKNANPHAEVSVKLVAEVGVGTIAAGVAKGFADRILISGDGGGTGASPLSSIRHAGVPWELGLAETQQTLVRNRLRGRVRLQTDGQMKTGRDVIVAACLGAEEYGFSTAPLIAMGCIMMRKCHLNTCPVGIATQDPVLRKRFTGTPEQVINYFFFMAEEVREYLSLMGFRSIEEIVGRMDLLKPSNLSHHWKARGLRLEEMLQLPDVAHGTPIRCVERQAERLAEQIDWDLVEQCRVSIETQQPVHLSSVIANHNRTTGTILSYHVTKRWGEKGLPEDTINIHFRGSAGQSFGAFVTRGISLRITGDANDYVGKGLSGGKIIVAPAAESGCRAEENIIIGNVALYGATSGEAYFRGRAGERFAVRNSGVRCVVEGIGEHGCEYMTGGVVVVLGQTGRNFAAGMSGGFAFVHDPQQRFASNCNPEMVDLVGVEDDADIGTLHNMISRHALYTGSVVAEGLLKDFGSALKQFVKVFPKDYRRVLSQKAEIQREWELVNR